MPIEISKDELKDYLKSFLRLYRTKIKEEYQAYFNEFPFYSALRAIGVITHHKVYIFFTKNGNPQKTTIEVFDENDIPELIKVKDAYIRKDHDVCTLLGIKNYIPDQVQDWQIQRSNGALEYYKEHILLGQWSSQSEATIYTLLTEGRILLWLSVGHMHLLLFQNIILYTTL